MTTLQVLLVGGGGSGATNSLFYGPLGGGGGEVRIVDFSADLTASLHIVVGTAGVQSSAASGVLAPQIARPGTTPGVTTSGSSGNGNTGYWVFGGTTTPGGGGGAGSSAPGASGGTGVVASAGGGSLFAGDSTCYGGGGAAGVHGSTAGTADCGGGTVTDGATTMTANSPLANSGGGGSGTDSGSSVGASGVVVVRWNAPAAVTLTFAGNLHGASVPSETVASGSPPTKPTDPAAAGFVFKGWYTDPALTTAANFSNPISADTTFYASFAPVLAATGGGFNPIELPIGIAALAAGLALSMATIRRRAQRTA
jgi:uncharacterized repeat protein (TIGR02543 family)